jgi:outer membrane protein, heavy metal efflux system
MWLRLAALAVFAASPCALAQDAAPPASPGAQAPLTLDAAIDRIARVHPDLRLPTLQREVLLAQAELAAQRAPLTLAADLENALGSGDTRGFDSAELTVSLSGLIERGGKLDARRALALANLDALAPQREIVRLDLMAEAARRYLAVAAARERAAIARSDIAQRQRAVQAARQRLQAGASPASVLLTAQAALAQAELDRDRAQLDADAARRSLALLWGGGDCDVAEVAGDPLRLPPLQDLAGLLRLLDATPELAQIAGEARIRAAQLQLARSAARADLGWQLGVRQLRERDDTALVAALSVTLGGAARAAPQIRAAEGELAMSALQRQSRQQQLQATLADAHARYSGARLEVQRMGRDVLPQLLRAEAAAEAAWRAGAISYLEWAQLQAMRIEARQRQLDAALAAQSALIELQRLTGQPLLATDTEGTSR